MINNPTTIKGTPSQLLANNLDNTLQAGQVALSIAPDPILPGTGSVKVAAGTTAERSVTGIDGMIRYNTTLGRFEGYQLGDWRQFSASNNSTTISVFSGQIAALSGTSVVPFDNTTPLVTEGTQVWSQTVTPEYTTSTFNIVSPFTVDCNSNNRIIIASLFRDSVNIGSALFYTTGGGRPTTMTLSVLDNPGTVSPIIYSMRIGTDSGATWYVNSTSSGNNLGGALLSDYLILEVA